MKSLWRDWWFLFLVVSLVLTIAYGGYGTIFCMACLLIYFMLRILEEASKKSEKEAPVIPSDDFEVI